MTSRSSRSSTTASASTTQQQGIVVEESANKLLRFETYYEGGSVRLFVAAIDGGTADILHSSTVPTGTAVYLKLRRVGNSWTFSYSNDGDGWRATGFSARSRSPPSGPTSETAAASSPPSRARSTTSVRSRTASPPVISQVANRPVSRSAQVTWTTDEPASSVVEYRQGSGAWQTRTGTEPLETRHTVAATGMACATTYSFRVKSADANGNLATSAESSLTTPACTAAGGPDIDSGAATRMTFGEQGIPQTWVNVIGNVSDPDGVQSITGALNDNGAEQLGFTVDGWRIQRPGDFNYEINTDVLMPGANTITLRATDTGGRVTTKTVTVNWAGQAAGATPSTTGPVLVVAAHPDDESLGMSGIIDAARSAGRRVIVAIVTNGEGSQAETTTTYCNGPVDAREAARYALIRDGETRNAMTVLGLNWTTNLNTTGLVFLGYPGGRVPDVAAADTSPLTNSVTGIQRTFAEDFDASATTCNGDFRYLLSGTHSQFTAAAMRADFDSLLAVTSPTDIYTHSSFDGHPDHGEISRQLVAAVKRANSPVRVHTTLMHPYGRHQLHGPLVGALAEPVAGQQQPVRALHADARLHRRRRPSPATRPTRPRAGARWAPPNESVIVPASMQSTSEATNKKWQAITKHETQIDCTNPDEYHVNCGYMRAFVKRNEFFWRYNFGNRRIWPKTYSTNWTSNASITQQAQVLEGQWRYENGGVRPLTTGFDRALLIGDMGWINYDVKAPFTINSFDPTTPQGAAVGLAVGWQGHNAWGQPRHGHPGGGLCLYARGGSDPEPFKLQLGYSPGPGRRHDARVGGQVAGDRRPVHDAASARRASRPA